MCDPSTDDVEVLLYAVHSPEELIALLRPALIPHPHAAILDLGGRIESWVPAALGFLAYLRPDRPPEEVQHCLELVARGLPYASSPTDGEFHLARERGILTLEHRRILDLRASGHTNEQISEALHLASSTLRRRLAEIRRLIGLQRGEDLGLLAARRMGFGGA